jgi:lia operon protein LiaG
VKIKKKVIIASIVVVAIAGVLAIIGVNMFREINDEKHISLTGIDEMQVTMSSAAIHIIRTETDNEVRFHYYGTSLQEVKIVSKTSNNTLSVNAERKYTFLGSAERMSLDIFIPEGYQGAIAIKTSSGQVKMDSGILADFTFKTNSGGFETEKLKAEKVVLNTTSGKIDIKTLWADELEIKGTSSSINIGECIVRKTRIKTTSGSIYMTYQQFENTNLNIENTSGGITLGLPGSAEFIMKAGNTSGKIQCDFLFDSVGSTDSHKLEGQVGTKSNTVTLQTTSGNIRILKIER